ncbi:hypothetical protein, partial [Streptomyces albus]|uniref:hypothetical protein n=1 Tax=Streptomyces albus TaxID=1888 RepID=UPI0039EE8C0D
HHHSSPVSLAPCVLRPPDTWQTPTAQTAASTGLEHPGPACRKTLNQDRTRPRAAIATCQPAGTKLWAPNENSLTLSGDPEAGNNPRAQTRGFSSERATGIEPAL